MKTALLLALLLFPALAFSQEEQGNYRQANLLLFGQAQWFFLDYSAQGMGIGTADQSLASLGALLELPVGSKTNLLFKFAYAYYDNTTQPNAYSGLIGTKSSGTGTNIGFGVRIFFKKKHSDY